MASPHHFIFMRAYGRAKPRALARFISIKENGRCFYFEISSTGAVIAPPELTDESVTRPCAQTELPDPLSPSSAKAHCEYQFVGLFDPNKVKEPIVPSIRFPVPGYSIQDLLAGPIPK
jgi:hypothetical protein